MQYIRRVDRNKILNRHCNINHWDDKILDAQMKDEEAWKVKD
jgi:hypothetical protein